MPEPQGGGEENGVNNELATDAALTSLTWTSKYPLLKKWKKSELDLSN